MDHSASVTCLRCDFSEDPRLVVDRDDCVNNPCPAGCLCQDLWQESFCLCPGNTVPSATGGKQKANNSNQTIAYF